ncbi:helix-turn-helix transcriptional regulator [Niallia sp. XMNu-256]|uniref:helix-turn-helix transcriptional regulator n=1 Tax=Niallia sp. XMNu-256 TaxID=3082444 RepID=UPI0030D0B967
MSRNIGPKRLKKYRIEKGISIYDLAEIVRADPSTISYWENGKKYPRHEKIIALEDYFERHYRDLFTDLTDHEIKVLENLEKLKRLNK